jgi:hypothetical protein
MRHIMQIRIAGGIWAAVAISLAGPVVGQESARFTGEMGALWESRYMGEGRDGLEEGGLFSSAIEAVTAVPVGDLTIGAWYGSGYDVDYTEMNLGAEWSVPVGPVELSAGYTYLDFISDDADDNEVSLGLRYTERETVVPFVGAYYSFEAEGSFIEAGVESTIAVTENVSVDPFVLIGFNEGYVVDGHNGANHVAIGLQTSLPLNESLALEASFAYSIAIDKDEDRFADDASLDDLAYGSIGLSAAF